MSDVSDRAPYVEEPARRTPVARDVDVLVVGGGLAGVAAAVAAARNGSHVLMVERSAFLGGTATGAFPGAFGTLDDWEGRPILGGLINEIIARLREKDGARQEPWRLSPEMERQLGLEDFFARHPRPQSAATRIDFELLKFVCDDLVRKAGVEVLFDTWAVEALMQGASAQGIIAQAKSGRFAIRAKVTIDASGDGDVAASAGAPFRVGAEADGRLQPVSVMFLVTNVDVAIALTHEQESPDNRGFASSLRRARQFGDIVDFPHDRLPAWRPTFSPDTVWFNATRVLDVDGTDPEQTSRGLVEGRRQVEMLLNFLRGYVPGFENARLLCTAPLLGIRETRRIIGEYVLTEDDVIAGRRFDDVVVRRAIIIDVHNPAGAGFHPIELKDGTFFDVPYRCLVPQAIDNLLVAGRCISTTHLAQGATRPMVVCVGTGQAAGIAAALALQRAETPRKLPVRLLQKQLREQGVLLGPSTKTEPNTGRSNQRQQ